MERVEKFSEIEKVEKNPYMGDLQYEVMIKKRGYIGGTVDKLLIDPLTGEESELRIVGSYKEVDQEAFVKVYKNRLKNLFAMTKTGYSVFSYVLQELEPNKGEVYIFIKDLMEYANWDQAKMAYRGLTELYNAGILTPSSRPNWYFINPRVVFNGNRIAYVEEYRLVETTGRVVGDDPLKAITGMRDETGGSAIGEEIVRETPHGEAGRVDIPEGYVAPGS